MSIPQIIDVASLGVGSILGVLIMSRTSLHFFIDQAHIQIELPRNLKLPKQRYAVVDIYGKCSKIQLHPTRYIKDTELSSPAHTLKLPYEALSNRLRTRVVSCKKNLSKKKEPLVASSTVEHVSQLLLPSNDVHNPSSVDTGTAVVSKPVSLVNHRENSVDHQSSCEYQIICERFLQSLNLPGELLSLRCLPKLLISVRCALFGRYV